jgi:CheY-like chemotaxis protein
MGQAQQERRVVLIVEDDAELRGLTVALLEDGGLDTIEVKAPKLRLQPC